MNKSDLTKWITAYKRSYETDDADLMVTLFTPDAMYQVSPFAEPSHGRDFHAMWSGGKKRRTGNHIALEIWHIDGNMAVVQWLAHAIYFEKGLRQGNGIFRLEFAPDGRCAALYEWQHWRWLEASAAQVGARA
ncbi:MAG: nuclear transport factor 2 family protein [Alphaproteobacteria bacterium]